MPADTSLFSPPALTPCLLRTPREEIWLWLDDCEGARAVRHD
ncbi:MAG: hypothetical protein WD042_03485 [Phycisphaeraceae bacterium]